MGYLRHKASQCGYKNEKKYRRLKQLFINGISDEEMMTEIIRQLTVTKETNKVTSEQVLCWAQRIHVKRA